MTALHMNAAWYGDAIPFDRYDEHDRNNGHDGWYQRDSLCARAQSLRDITNRTEDVTCGTCKRLMPVFDRRWAAEYWPDGVPSWITSHGNVA